MTEGTHKVTLLCNVALLGALVLACDSQPSAGLPPAIACSVAPSAAAPARPVVGALPSFADLASASNPAVVSVKTTVEHSGLHGQAEGSAFIYSADGLVLTNNHVIAHASEIRVVLGAAREFGARVVGQDSPTDIAVLKIDAVGLPNLKLGDSDGLRVGEWVIAIGNPFGLAHTVSAGIVSAKGRTAQDVHGLGDGTGYYNFLQTDASINPGNSGGPLIDLGGSVVGINTAIRAEANSIGFAIPINMVKELLPRLIKDGRIARSAIGITVSALADADVQPMRLPDSSGALVRSVLPGGPGDQAGLKPGDVIVSFNGHRVPGPERLRWEASLLGVGRRASVIVVRQSRQFDLSVKLGKLTPPR